MPYTATATATATSTMTEARVREVTRKVAANFTALVTAGSLDREVALQWLLDLVYLQVQEAVEFFEVQCTTPSGARFGLRYAVSSDGSIREDSSSGGIDVYGIPAGTLVSLLARFRPNLPHSVGDELRRRGWTYGGTALEGEHTGQRSFSTGGYGVTRTKVGTWP